MGESSGGTSVAAHLVSRASWGFFHKAILESPGLTQTKPLAAAEQNYDYLLAALLAVRSPGCERASPPPPPVGGALALASAPLASAALASAALASAALASGGLAPAARADGAPPGAPALLGAYTRFDGAALVRAEIGGGVGWSFARAAAECDARPLCAGFTQGRGLHRPGAPPAPPGENETTLHMSPMLVGGGYLHLPANASVVTHLKAGARGDAGIACLVQAKGETLNELTQFMPRDDTFQTDAFAPVLDGIAFAEPITDAVAAGRIPPAVPLLMGSNMDEGTIFMGLTPYMRCPATAEQLSAWALAFYGDALGARVPALYAHLRQPVPACSRHGAGGTAAVRAVRAAATSWPPQPPPPPPPPGATVANYMAAMRSAGDSAITCRVRDAARVAAAGDRPTYVYYFVHTPSFSMNYDDLPALGAFHGSEVPFVFGYAAELKTEGERGLSHAMGRFWRNFVWSGDPNGEGASRARSPNATRGGGEMPTTLPTWPRFVGDGAGSHSSGQDQTMVLDVGSLKAVPALKRAQCDAFAHARRR